MLTLTLRIVHIRLAITNRPIQEWGGSHKRLDTTFLAWNDETMLKWLEERLLLHLQLQARYASKARALVQMPRCMRLLGGIILGHPRQTKV